MKCERRTAEKSVAKKRKRKRRKSGWGLAFGLLSPAGKRNKRGQRRGKERERKAKV
jgi:hypothetical protein